MIDDPDYVVVNDDPLAAPKENTESDSVDEEDIEHAYLEDALSEVKPLEKAKSQSQHEQSQPEEAKSQSQAEKEKSLSVHNQSQPEDPQPEEPQPEDPQPEIQPEVPKKQPVPKPRRKTSSAFDEEEEWDARPKKPRPSPRGSKKTSPSKIPRKSSLSSTEDAEMVEMIDTSSKEPRSKSKPQSKSKAKPLSQIPEEDEIDYGPELYPDG